MKMPWAVIVLAMLTTMSAAEPELPVSGTPEPETPEPAPPKPVPEPAASTPAMNAPVALSDFIIPIANDVRFGYSANIGRYHRSQDDGEGADSDFVEHGLWVSYVRALSGPGRVLSGRAEWRAEVGLLVSQADVSNSNGSTGTLRTATLNLGIGPAWRITESDSSRLEVELMPFVGGGFSDYENDYTTDVSGFRGAAEISANGLCLEYGIKANLMWCWSNGWGAALHAGLVQRVGKLEGDSTTSWSNGQVTRSAYVSDDTLTGVRFGLFVARRF